MPKGIGSLLPPPQAGGTGILETWRDGRPYQMFRTARAALAVWLTQRKVTRVWLPAYICPAVADAVQASGASLVWYPTDSRLHACTQTLSAALSGDAVLCVHYFGRGIDPALRTLAAQRPDLLWIEDRAQAMYTQGPAFGDALLYSPRKLFGVGDGGLMATTEACPPLSAPTDDGPDDGPNDWQANDARAADPQGLTPERWFPAFQAREADMDCAPRPASARTLQCLSQLEWHTEAEARRRNWRLLSARLSDMALWPEADIDFVPLAYPIVVDEAPALQADLARAQIWCARHWASLPAPKHYGDAHDLSQRCLSLPLDGRYGAEDMQRIAETIRLIRDRQGKSR